MKKLFSVLIVFSLLFMMSWAVMAEGTVSLDYLSGNGQMKDDYVYANPGMYGTDIENHNSTGFALSADYNFNRFVVGFDYVSGNNQNNYSETTSSFTANNTESFNYYNLKAGYRIVENDHFNLALDAIYTNETASYLYEFSWNDLSDGDKNFTINGFMIGTDINWHFSKKFSLNASLAYGIGVTNKNFWDKDWTDQSDSKSTNLVANSLKVNYLVTESFGLSLGYRMYQPTVKYTSSLNSNIYETISDNLGGVTFGAFYKF